MYQVTGPVCLCMFGYFFRPTCLSLHIRQEAKENTMPKSYDWADISNHSKPEDLFLVIEGRVYDVTRFQHEHPCVVLSLA